MFRWQLTTLATPRVVALQLRPYRHIPAVARARSAVATALFAARKSSLHPGDAGEAWEAGFEAHRAITMISEAAARVAALEVRHG